MSSTSKGPARRPNASTAASAARSRSRVVGDTDSAQAEVAVANLQVAPWGQMMGDVMQLWLDQLAQGQRTGGAVSHSACRRRCGLWIDR